MKERKREKVNKEKRKTEWEEGVNEEIVCKRDRKKIVRRKEKKKANERKR